MSEDQLQPEDSLDDRGVADVLDEGYSPPDREPYHLRHPDHESLSERLMDETPEIWNVDAERPDRESDTEGLDGEWDADEFDGLPDARTGRLAEASDGVHEHNDLYAQDDGIDGAGASAEEAAMHTITEY